MLYPIHLEGLYVLKAKVIVGLQNHKCIDQLMRNTALCGWFVFPLTLLKKCEKVFLEY